MSETIIEEQEQQTPTVPAPGKGLKMLVIGMGVLLVIGFAVVIVEIIHRAGDLASGVQEIETQTDELILPEGAQIVDIFATNYRVVIRTKGQDKQEKLYLLDGRSGALRGSVDVKQGVSP